VWVLGMEAPKTKNHTPLEGGCGSKKKTEFVFCPGEKRMARRPLAEKTGAIFFGGIRTGGSSGRTNAVGRAEIGGGPAFRVAASF